MTRLAPAANRPWREHLAWARDVLRGAGCAAPEAEARWLVEHASGWEAAEWLAHAEATPPARAVQRLHEMVGRRVVGEPLQYVLGEWPFRRVELMVDRRVLIPRPETEVVVEVALAEARRQGITARRNRRAAPPEPGSGPVVVDLGTGSGAIALSLAAELVVEVWATDRAPDALAVARANAAGNALRGVTFALGEWYAALPGELRGRCALIVSNPPYVAAAELAELPAEVRDYEPVEALVAGPTGYEDLEVIVQDAPGWLAPGGALVVELAPHQAARMAAHATAAGLVDVTVHEDLAGRPRVLVARHAPAGAPAGPAEPAA